MEVLEEFGFKSRGEKASYDWDTFLDGRILQLEQGTDYECKTSTFCTLIRNQAKKRGLGVRTSLTEGGVIIQGYEQKRK